MRPTAALCLSLLFIACSKSEPPKPGTAVEAVSGEQGDLCASDAFDGLLEKYVASGASTMGD